MFAARRVVGREVEGVEVELLGLHLGPLGQFPSHRDERVGDVFGQHDDRVPGAGRHPSRGQCDIDTFGHQHGRVALGTQRRQPFVVAALSGIAGGVDALTGLGSLFFGQHGQRLPRQRQRRAVAEMLRLDARQDVQGVR